MNIVNIIIIISILLSLAVIIFVIIRSLKSVDDTIIEELKTKKTIEKKNITQRIKGKVVLFFEMIVKKINNITQKLHSWIVKVKKREKSDVVKAKDELSIDNSDADIDNLVINNKKRKVKNKKKIKPRIKKDKKNDPDSVKSLDTYFNEPTVVEDISTKNVTKKGLLKSLFKNKKKKKGKNDIIIDEGENWSLGGEEKNDKAVKFKEKKLAVNINPVGEKFKRANTSRDIKAVSEDDVIGVDREILEKKILQKIDKSPKNVDNYKELGSLYIKMEKLDDALEVFNYVLSVAPRDVEALNKQNKIKLLKKLQK